MEPRVLSFPASDPSIPRTDAEERERPSVCAGKVLLCPQVSGPLGQLKFWFSSSVLWPPIFLATTWASFDLAEKTGGPPKPWFL